MKSWNRIVIACAGLVVTLPSGSSWGQAPPAAGAGDAAEQAVESIQGQFEKGLVELRKQRLRQLEALAQKAEPERGGPISQALFETAIADNLYQEAEAAAGRVIALGDKADADTWLLARIVDLVAKVDRGATKESVESLRASVAALPAPAPGAQAAARPGLPVATVVSLLEVYYRRLVEKEQYAAAREAFELIRARAQDPALQEYLDQRLARLAMVGQPAPAIGGTDIDGQQFRLEEYQGQAVLVVFWASWCLPSAQEADDFLRVYEDYREKGLRVVGINLDTLEEGGPAIEALLPNIKRFLLDYNIPWPNLVNGTGVQDYAAAYKVTDLPANVLIDREGKIRDLDLGIGNIEPVLQAVLGK